VKHSLLVILFFVGPLACDDDSTAPASPTVKLAFETKTVASLVDSTAYVTVIPPDKVELVGFYTSCAYQIEGRLVQAEPEGFVVDAEISDCVGVLCIVNKNSRYQATLTGLSPGEHRFILEALVRHCASGELLAHETVLDTVLTIP
jgi:hypothetical protein